MKTLFILRHAKSSWTDAALSDFERPLNDRGKKAAVFMGEMMSRMGYAPNVILSSPAARAKATTERVKTAGNLEAEVRFEDRIYEASSQTLRQIVDDIDDTYSTAMLVGHNPGIEGFIRYVTGQIEAIPTAALSIIDMDIDSWNSVTEGIGRLRKIYRPREEMQHGC